MPEVHNRKIDRRTGMEERISEEQLAEVQVPAAQRRDNEGIYNKDTLCYTLYKLRIAPCFALSQSYRYEDFAAFALHPHTCCLRNRIQSLMRASRATILSAFSKSLYSRYMKGNY